jgi:hypothetical protein
MTTPPPPTASIPDAATAAAGHTPPMFQESMAGALIDSARISVMASMGMLPAYSRIVLPGDEDEPPNVHDCLDQAMQWLNAARAQTIEQSGTPPTSLHIIQP